MEKGIVQCIKCGRPLQAVFFGIAHQFTGGVFIQTDSEGFGYWLVCTNPKCDDGCRNANLQSIREVDL